jgi:hypothetical protein
MTDEQTRLLQKILEVQQEHLAFVRQQHDELMAIQHTALAAQRKGLGVSGCAIAFIIGMFVFIAALVVPLISLKENPPIPAPAKALPEK